MVFHLAQLVNDNLEAPLRVANVRIEGAHNTRKPFLGWLVRPWLSAHSSSLPLPSSSENPFAKSNTSSLDPFPHHPTLKSVLHTARGIGSVLQDTDIFKSVDARIEASRDPQAAPGDVDIVFKTREKGKFYLKTATEFGHNDGNASATGRIRNALGGGETVEANVSFGTKTRRAYHALFAVPLSPDLRTRGELSLYGLERDLSSYASASEGLRGIRAAIRSDQGALGVHEVAYDAVLRHIGSLTSSASISMRESAGQTFKSALSHSWTLDTRDAGARIAAARGMLAKFSHELAGVGPLGGDASFYKAEGETQASRVLFPGLSASVSARAGILHHFTGKSHFSDRFQLGGPLSVRSFRANSLGPRDGPDSLGGDLYWATGLSLISDLPYKPHWPLKLHAFVNAGRLDAMDRTKSLADNVSACVRAPSVSAGVGLLYRFDPVRVEVNFGVPLVASKSDGLRKGVQVGIGIDFL
ncbi:hypothetical protein CONPUDRAFT_84348 [Coniophora puteana RWD-64-598 SS2]|uniref:Bacterial surface antigen (D15) domain-containing protein n=1 Tax=Coniophora puteana (strain RWD-64-598) TaxID=741705 RepID=A0A5M3MD13_CONPW|nr:uncharacterized protein CONPUDRAFT_84348 [Coniophora puteana RWD-64-598 SS2]EIW77129.1 hypothetical protein CONPUDRAFT_84348 [Coniophora puteana RWD-64-598 SS2]